MTLVIDASVVVKWLVEEELVDEAAGLLGGSSPLHAPDLIVSEVTNAWTHPGKVEAPYTVCIASASNLTGLVKSSVECRRTGL